MTANRDRFLGIDRLYGAGSVVRLAHAHVCVVGIGGVGSWVVEALARSGVGHLTLIDADEVCVSNTNRQLHALDGEFGKAKVAVIAARARSIPVSQSMRLPNSSPRRISRVCSIAATRWSSMPAMHSA
jgi:tRNA A37 threonylcarbamoyladenosine dehydratase